MNQARQADPFLAARVKEETDAGIVVRGCRMLATLPICDEIMVFPSTLLKSPEEDAPYAFGFVIPTNTPGLRFLCRESFDDGRSHFDHPLSSRFEEMDAVVIFDDVFVPWENILLYRDINRCNQAYSRTGAVVHMTHQVVVKNIAKAEFMLGLAHLLVDAIGAEGFQHIHEKLAELWVNMETMKAFLRAAEADAALDEWGVMRPAWNPLDAARNLFPRLYPRMVEIIQQIGASGLVAMPVEADLKGPLAAEVKHYYQAARAEAFDRIPLFRLAWDASLSAFGSRQVLYERFFFGDPVRMAGALLASHRSRDPGAGRARRASSSAKGATRPSPRRRAEGAGALSPAAPHAARVSRDARTVRHGRLGDRHRDRRPDPCDDRECGLFAVARSDAGAVLPGQARPLLAALAARRRASRSIFCATSRRRCRPISRASGRTRRRRGTASSAPPPACRGSRAASPR